ncbi:hypothetical protein BJX70DRAFT_12206 [Aspergillus crustosus]
MRPCLTSGGWLYSASVAFRKHHRRLCDGSNSTHTVPNPENEQQSTSEPSFHGISRTECGDRSGKLILSLPPHGSNNAGPQSGTANGSSIQMAARDCQRLPDRGAEEMKPRQPNGVNQC